MSAQTLPVHRLPANATVADRLAIEGWSRLSSGLDDAVLDAVRADVVLSGDGAGSRNMLLHAGCAALVDTLRRRLVAVGAIAADAVAVQCTLFRKTADCNWKVPYHQDLSIPVAGRVAHPALSGWSSKEDGDYVQPPAALLARTLAVRLHLDACGASDGPLRVLAGSHVRGRIACDAIPDLRNAHPERVCDAAAGDLVLMRPLLLHASSKADRPSGRRVLHFLFGPPQPGYGLDWSVAI